MISSIVLGERTLVDHAEDMDWSMAMHFGDPSDGESIVERNRALLAIQVESLTMMGDGIDLIHGAHTFRDIVGMQLRRALPVVSGSTVTRDRPLLSRRQLLQRLGVGSTAEVPPTHTSVPTRRSRGREKVSSMCFLSRPPPHPHPQSEPSVSRASSSTLLQFLQRITCLASKDLRSTAISAWLRSSILSIALMLKLSMLQRLGSLWLHAVARHQRHYSRVRLLKCFVREEV